MNFDLPTNWAWVKLGDVCQINPKLFSNRINENTEVTFLPMRFVEALTGKINLSESRKLSEVKKGYTYFGEGDIIFAKITPCMENGKIAITRNLKNKIGYGSTEFHVLRPNENLSNKFLFHFLTQSSYRKLAQHSMTGTAGQLRVPKKFLENSTIPLPPLKEQHRIVEKIEELFSELNNGIEKLKKAKEQIKTYRQAVLKFAFEGKLTQGKSKKAKSKGENGELPEGWKWTPLEKITTKLGDGLHGTPKYSEDGDYYFINGNNLSDGKILIKGNTKRISYQEYEKYKKPLNERTIFVSINGTLGNTAFYNGENIILGKSACYINLIEKVNKQFIRYFLKSQLFLNYASESATGSTIKNVSLKSMRELQIPVPPSTEIQNQVVQEIESRFSIADKVEETIDESLQKAEALRQSILKQAFEGKLV